METMVPIEVLVKKRPIWSQGDCGMITLVFYIQVLPTKRAIWSLGNGGIEKRDFWSPKRVLIEM